ncbi:hypothetical protein NGF19_28045 [Streptomyces sp. RY43-2]|uniref:Secreted protein n=1 Tax=Streptomyces macrolidinus TaxID=2952607 RepID=A0ABT0ZLY1_9ACTN|nr:hypothetical protein [Streptomyces macrolidinus]MCN9244586.1 hypothetical protein [Streptomyces macrolidinus]
MRLFRRIAPWLVAVPLVMSLPYEALPQARVRPASTPAPEPFGADCRVRVSGSAVVAYCFNPYPLSDHVSLHIDCARWWDIDTDTAPVEAAPATTVRMTGRCWDTVRSAWANHQR